MAAHGHPPSATAGFDSKHAFSGFNINFLNFTKISGVPRLCNIAMLQPAREK
jgi:hypothetical protein